MVPKALLNTLLLALVVAANPVPSLVKLPLTRRFNSANGTALNLLKRDQARVRSLVTRSVINEPITDNAVHYTASVEVGAGTYNLLVDTGSSNTWVGAGQAYQPGPNSQDTGETVQYSYGSGSFSGEEYTDDVTLAPGLTVSGQSIGVASSSTGFDGLDGVLGIGPTDLTAGTTSGGGTIPTVTDNLFSQGSISAHEISISFEPTTSSQPEQNGELTWGGVDSSKYTGPLTYVPITSASGASKYWGIDQSITYGSQGTQILSTTAGIVDTATSLIHLATQAFNAYQTATGATLDSTTGLLTLTDAQFANLQSLFFQIGGTTFELTPNAQIWPRSLNSAIGGASGDIYLIVTALGADDIQGVKFINGYAFLERFYTVYDTANSQVGFATTPFTDATTN